MNHSKSIPTYRGRGPLSRAIAISLGLLAAGSLVASAGAADQAVNPTNDVFLPPANFVVKNAIEINLTRRYVRLPLHKGSYNGTTCWFLITDVSDQSLADKLGVNFSAKLTNVPNNAPGAFQTLNVPRDITQAGTVEFAGVPDFSPSRLVVPGPAGFPLLGAEAGAVAGLGYSPYIQPAGTDIIYNAPIIAMGDGPFDLDHHTNTHDRLTGINTQSMTADMLFIQAFSGGKEVIYLSLDATTPEAAALERSTFTPVLSETSFPDGAFRKDGARATIYSFINGQTGSMSPPAQGLNHLVVDGRITEEATPTSFDVFDALRHDGDARNVLEVFPTMLDPKLRLEYSPAWDFHLVMWPLEIVAAGRNVAQTDGFKIRTLAQSFTVTSPGGLMLKAAGIEVNCPVMAFVDEPPLRPLVPSPVPLPLPFRL